MINDARLEELLARLEEARLRGENPTADELCADCPELLGALQHVLNEREVGKPTGTVTQPPRIDAAVKTEVSPTDTYDDESTEDLTGFLAPPRGPEELGRLGHFRVVKLLGAGGMGAVFQAVDEQLGRSVAIKTLRPRLAASPTARKRFLREARAVAALSHDHVVAVYHVGEEHGVPFLVMPFLHGKSLDDRLKEEDRLPVCAVLRITREIAEGLSAAHERGMVHRDIKPANIWLEAPRDRVKILDFGLAHTAEVEEARLTQTGAVMGTPSYTSPEQAQGEPVDHRSDLFSLGTVSYRMATGRAPFQGKSIPAILMAVVHDEPVPPLSLAPDLPPAFGALIMRLLTKDPSARPNSAHSVVETIETIERELAASATATAPVVIPPVTPVELPRVEEPAKPSVPSTSPTRKRPRWWAAAALALVALIGGGAVLSQVVIRLRNEDGTETEIKVPATTKVTVDDAGKVTEFPARKAEPPAPIPVPTPAPVATAWKPGFPEGSLPGLLPRQAWLPGLGRWQVETVAPRADLSRLAWSAQGMIALSNGLGTVRVYEAKTLVLKRLSQQGFSISSVAWNPAGIDLAIAASFMPVNRVWKADGTVVEFHGDDSGTNSVAWSPDGTRLAGAGKDGTVRVWQADGTAGPVLKGHEGEVHAVAWSPDGMRLASGGADKTVRIWQVDGTAGPVLKGHEGPVFAVTWHPKDGRLVSGGEDRDIRFWEADGTPGAVLKGHVDAVWSLAWSPDGSRLLSGGSGGIVRTWEADGRAGVRADFGRDWATTAWGPDGQQFAASGNGAFLQIWAADGTPAASLSGNHGWQGHVTWDRDGARLAITLPISKEPGRGAVTLAPDGHPGPVIRSTNTRVKRVAWSPDGTRLAALGSWDGTDRLALLHPDGRVARILPDPSAQSWWTGALAWSPDGARLADASEGRKDLRVWETDGVAGPAVWKTEVPLKTVAWSSDGTRLAAAGENGKIYTWRADGKTGPILEGHTGWVNNLAWRPKSDTLASCGEDGTIRLWEQGDRPGKVVKVGGAVTSLNWEPGGARLASGDQFGIVRLWSAADEPLRVLKDHDYCVQSVAWSPRGDRIASLDMACKVVVWDAVSGEPVWIAIPLTDNHVAVFSPAGELLYGDPDRVDKELVFTVENDRGGLDLMTRTAFLKRAAEARATSANDAVDFAADAVDFAAERHAAEWLLQQVARDGGSFDIADADGKPIGSFGKRVDRFSGFFPPTEADGPSVGAVNKPALSKLPDTPFVVARISLLQGFATDRELHHLAGCRRVRTVALQENRGVSSRGLQALRGCRSLRELNLLKTGVGDDFGNLLPYWPELERLCLLGCGMLGDGATRTWPDCPRLRRLHLSSTAISDAGLARIVKHCPNLDEVHIEADELNGNPRSVATLMPLRDLRAVAFGGVQLTDQGVAALRAMPRLEHVWIGAPIKDEDIKRLAAVGEKLMVLDVSNDLITDAGYVAIARMRGVRNLKLAGDMSPSDEALGKLAELPGLQTLELYFEEAARRYTAAGIATFRARRPDVAVNGTTHPATAPAPPSP